MMKLIKKPSIKELTSKRVSALGRSRGKIVVRHKETGLYQNTYFVDWCYIIWNIPGVILAKEQNAKTGTFLWLVGYPIGVISYKIGVGGKSVGDLVLTGWNITASTGNSLPLLRIPLNVKISLIESYPGSGAIYVRSAGNWAVIVAKKASLAKVFFRNGNTKYINMNSMATVGRVTNMKKIQRKFKKAGDLRARGYRPRVRGVAKNAADHPHGGGKGKKSKNSPPEPPWGRKYIKKKKRDKRIF